MARCARQPPPTGPSEADGTACHWELPWLAMDHLRHADLWHTGIVVDDLAGAMTELGAQLGVSWYEGGAEVRMTTEAGTTTVTTSYALSRSEEHTSELQSLMRNSYAGFCL